MHNFQPANFRADKSKPIQKIYLDHQIIFDLLQCFLSLFVYLSLSFYLSLSGLCLLKEGHACARPDNLRGTQTDKENKRYFEQPTKNDKRAYSTRRSTPCHAHGSVESASGSAPHDYFIAVISLSARYPTCFEMGFYSFILCLPFPAGFCPLSVCVWWCVCMSGRLFAVAPSLLFLVSFGQSTSLSLCQDRRPK
jgi:hypothetical protein